MIKVTVFPPYIAHRLKNAGSLKIVGDQSGGFQHFISEGPGLQGTDLAWSGRTQINEIYPEISGTLTSDK